MKASAATNLREEITAVLSQANDKDEIVVRSGKCRAAWFTAMGWHPAS